MVVERVGGGHSGQVPDHSCRELHVARGAAEAPEIDGKVYIDAPREACAAGGFVDVIITESDPYDLLATLA